MIAKPIRALQLHYPMIQFLIKINISCFAFLCIKKTETIFTALSACNKQSLCYYWSISTLPSLRCQILYSKVCRHGFLQRLPKASPCHKNPAKSIPVERHYCISLVSIPLLVEPSIPNWNPVSVPSTEITRVSLGIW